MVLVTGGAGYIGSHTVLELLNSGKQVVVVDDLSNSSDVALKRIEDLTGKKVIFYKENVANQNALDSIFKKHKIDSVIHFAGFKAVGESVEKPLMYYDNNLSSTISLLKAMNKANVKKLVFSSSATVYGLPDSVRFIETFTTSSLNPYGNTKKVIEEILIDESGADKNLRVALLRYFNPVGAHKSGLIGEDPRGIPNNLMPFITQVAVGKREKLSVFGNDYNTRDGTCIRDYIHVVDLSLGHLLALDALDKKTGVLIYNLGTGRGSSVLEVVNAFIKATGVNVPYVIAPRRAGDAPEYFAATDKAQKELGFVATHSLEDMCRDHYNWQKNNPNGYN